MKTQELEYWQVHIASGRDSLSYSELLNFVVDTPEEAIALTRKWLAMKSDTQVDVWWKSALIVDIKRIIPAGEFVDLKNINNT